MLVVLQAPEVFTIEMLVLCRPHLSDAAAIFEYNSDPKLAQLCKIDDLKNVNNTNLSKDREVFVSPCWVK
jgi:hypothetical protein